MSEFQRLVSYIYLYDKGIKIKNSGFAKIECKDDVLRIKINLKGAFNSNDQWGVYLLTEGHDEMLGIYIGEIKGKGANADFQMVGTANNISETTKSFEDLKGLAVISKGSKKYATFWKDTDITVENFREYVEEDTQKNTIFEKRRKESKYIYEIEDLKAMSIESKEKPNIKNEEEEEKQKEIKEEKQIEKQIEKHEDINKEESSNEKNMQKENIEEQNLCDGWDRYINQFKRVYPFSDKDEIECIRIELKDLKILPKSQWILCSNSFILHGYYNYQYLILGKVNDKFIIGVPGVFCNKEKLVASIFGFNEFKPAQVSEYKTGRFGYWYKYL